MLATSTTVKSCVGTWESPITSELVTCKSKALGHPLIQETQIEIDDQGFVYWTEGRPTEGGRQVVVRRAPDSVVEDVTPPVASGLNVRTCVHEYGGAAMCREGQHLYFSNFADQRLYCQDLSPVPGTPTPLTQQNTQQRFADGVVDSRRGRLICVVEDHAKQGKEAVNSISSVDFLSGAVTTLVQGADFYSNPRLSPDGSQLIWISWDHPNMPWDCTTLYCADVASDGTLANTRKVAGGDNRSVVQPTWSDRCGLYYITDESGWWNIYHEEAPGKSRNVCPLPNDFAIPSWVFGYRLYVELPDGKLLAVFQETTRAGSSLALIDPMTGEWQRVASEYIQYGNLALKQVGGEYLLATIGYSAVRPTEVVLMHLGDLVAGEIKRWEVIAKASDVQLDEAYISLPESVEYPTTQGRTSFMLYYPPKNKDFELPPAEQPPLLVHLHGGPTARASAAFSLGTQYWTTRGFAVAEVNYGGSSGYGRQYRDRLKGCNWGVVDVDDACSAAQYLVARGVVDGSRVCVSGGSAGGYTTLAALTFRDVFSVGASHFGVSSLELLIKETHKFERRYFYAMVGRYPEDREKYIQKSPFENRHLLQTPCMFFQGGKDVMVPPNQAEMMYGALKAQGVPTCLLMFPEEAHGFRDQSALRMSLDAELYFYGKILGFPVEMPHDLPHVHIVNLKE